MKQEYAIFVSPTSSDNHSTITLYVVKIVDGKKVRTILYNYQDRPSFCYEGLQASCLISHDFDRPYGFSVDYRNLFCVKAEQANRMAKTLNRVERMVHRAAERNGDPDTFGTFALRFARAIHAKIMLFEKENNKKFASWDLRDLGWATINKDAKDRLDSIVSELILKTRKGKAA